MQQMNHVLAQKALDGFFVAACDCGVNHREVPDGSMHHNLFYHILLKRVMPVTPTLHHPSLQVCWISHGFCLERMLFYHILLSNTFDIEKGTRVVLDENIAILYF